MDAQILSDVTSALGEGCLWHPTRASILWVDIFGGSVHEMHGGAHRSWDLGELVGALAWVSDREVLVSTKTGLRRLDLDNGHADLIAVVEPDRPDRRANDGRADHQGGFWFSMMDTKHRSEKAVIYRYYRGEIRALHDGLTVPNATCFSPDGLWAYFGDTRTSIVYRQSLDEATGWPRGEAETLVDFSQPRRRPDGATVDADGALWIAMWGEGLALCVAPDGRPVRQVSIGTPNASCVCFGGSNLQDLILTSATTDIDLSTDARAGKTFILPGVAQGVAEPKVILA
ncbi:SMP-30/gluconolactonase/LRE family protein [Boseongicola sp. H5]|uniref:SMP-30/gluconolactonase/LRE family protein n=1 Tax=Boseongicola sp. H5 TaxID=2763261 RepID=UPI001D09DAAE|nr:SMP-30/gluconolactonase/LRE family protein [Boseongicola sp. H5]